MATPTRKLQLLGASFGGGSGGSTTLEIPVFDLGALGLAAVPMTGGSGFVSVDATEIWTALSKGAVTFVVPMVVQGMTANLSATMHGATDGASMFLCTGTAYLEDMIFLNVNVYLEGVIMVTVTTLTGSIGAYIDEALGGEY